MGKEVIIKGIGVILVIFLLLISGYLIFVRETPVPYTKGIIDVVVPEDKGLEINIELPNYKRVNAFLVKCEEGYDIYMGVTQTAITQIFKASDTSSHMIRIGNGIVVDFKSGDVLGTVQKRNSEKAIKHIYYIENMPTSESNDLEAIDKELTDNEDKILVWENDIE